MNNDKIFEAEILKWFRKNGRTYLPWRKSNITPYEVWVSEIMLQQTQVSRVIDYYKKFLERFPTVFDLAKSNWEEFYPYYAGLGYYNRGRNMLRCSQMIVEKYNGIFPKTKEELRALPGIGDYTASAILSFAYKKNELAVDTNIKKVFGRYFEGSKDAKINFEEFHSRLSSSKKQLNAAVMDFSTSICIKVPRCGDCPLQTYCIYYKTDGQKESVQKRTQKTFPLKDAVVYLTLHKDHREYYSKNKTKLLPFILQKKWNTREKIKEYFLHKYHLRLAVRPPHKKLYIDKKPVIFVNAQILLGTHTFYIFENKKYGSQKRNTTGNARGFIRR